MTRLYDELKRRNVFRVGIAYVVAAWVVAQVADLVLENIGAPGWVIQALFFFMAVGFCAALVIAWAYEVTPEGIKRERDVDRSASITRVTGRRLDIVTIGLLVLAIGLLIADRLFLANPGVDPVATSPQTATDDGSLVAAGSAGPNMGPAAETSIAVLPFVNMSADVEQEYFADGISEEILNALVKAKGLRVAGRTSSFSFKGKDTTIGDIGKALNVAHVLEGSVRKQGNQVRVTAQLIKADDGFHLWSETYDRSLDNIFDVQDDISRQVTQALRVILDLDDRQRLVAQLTTSTEAYDLFLRGRDRVRTRVDNSLPEGMTLLRQSLALDPDFAEAWAVLAEAEAVAPDYLAADEASSSERAVQYAQTAIRLKPELALAHGVLGLSRADKGDFIGARERLGAAYELEPNNPLILRWLGNYNQVLGYSEKALDMHRRAFEINPLSGTDAFNVAAVQLSLGELDEASRMFQRTAELRGRVPGEYEAEIRLLKGDRDGAVAALLALHDDFTSSPRGRTIAWSREEAETFARGVYGGDVDAYREAQAFERLFDVRGDDRWYWQVASHLKLGRLDRAFGILEAKPGFFGPFGADYLWLPIDSIEAFRRHPRFPGLLQQRGIVAAWQAYGWPDACQPNEGTDGSDGQFTCT